MKPIYKSLALAAMTLQVSLALQAQINDGESVVEKSMQVADLDGLKVQLIAPNVSGARDLVAGEDYEVEGANIAITLNTSNWIKGATYRLQMVATFGTQTQVIYALDVTVPYYLALSDTPQEYEDTVVVVSTFGDGDKSGADATVYAKDGDGNAHITKPLSIGDGAASGSGAVASGRADGDGSYIQAGSEGAVASGRASGENSHIEASSDGAVASGYANGENSYIAACGNGAVASGCANGDGSYIQANSDGAVASGCADGENSYIAASGSGAVTSGRADGDGSYIQAGGEGAVASGRASGENSHIEASSDGAVASGRASGENSRIEANSDGAVASGYADGEGASIRAGGAGAIASGYADGDGASIQAGGNGAIASGYADATNGNVIASGQASQAFGIGVKATQDGQMAVGKCNVVDTNGDYALIVGNGTADNARSNAFAIDWNGNLVLFNAGTPVVLTPAKLATLIA